RHPWDPTLGITLRKISALANTTPIVTIVTKPAINPRREKRPRDADATPRVNIPDFCEEYYEDIMPIIMDKIRRDKRKEVHARLDFGERPRERRIREGSHYSSARTLSARYHNQSERLKMRDRLGYNDRHVLDRVGHRRQSAFERLSETYLPSITKSRPDKTSSRVVLAVEAALTGGTLLMETALRVETAPAASKNHMTTPIPPTGREPTTDIATATETAPTYDGTWDSKDHVKFFQAEAQVKCWAMPTWCHMFNSTLIGAARVWFDELPPESIDSYKDLKASFLAYFMQQKKYVKDQVETGRMKGAPECMRISGFMHGVNNPELTKCLNEHVPKTMKEMMITSTAFIREDAAVSQGKEGGLAGLPLLQEHQKKFSRLRHESSSRHHLWDGINQRLKKEAPAKDKSMEIYMIQSWQRMTRQKVTQSFKRVGEIAFPLLATNSGTEGPLVIEAEIGRHMIHRMYVDGGSSTKVLYEHCFNRLRQEVKNQIVLTTTSLTDFSGKTIWPLGQLRLLVTIGGADHSTRAWMNFMIVSTILIPDECTTVNTSSKEIPTEAGVRPENFKVALHLNFPDQEVAIEGTLSTKGRTYLCSLLKENLDIFTWQPSDMTRVPRSVAKHRLNIREGYLLVRQKKMGQAPERVKAIQAEVQKLVEAGIMREVYYHDWLSNTVMVKKHDGSWRISTRKKCTFGVVEGMFLGYMITPKGIKPYPNKTKAVLQLPSLRTIKEVQSLNGKLASLNRFLSKSAEKSLPLFKTLKKCIKKSDFHWTSKAKQAFKQLKQHLSELPLLLAPKPKEELIVYLFASYGAISAVLMTKRGTVEMPVYFVSRPLQGPELNYTPMEKLVLSLVFAAKRLRRRTITKIERHAGRTQYHIPAKDVGERTGPSGFPRRNAGRVVETQQEPWTLFTDGSSCMDGSGAGLILTSLEGTEFTYALRFQFTASNNEAEYEALIAGLRIAAQMEVRNVHVSVDSKLVANQVLGAYVAKEENMIKYLEKVKSLVSGFANFSINQVPRSKNKKTDALSKIASTSFAYLSKQVLVEILKEKSIQEKEVTTVVEEDGPTRMTPIIEYLKEGTLPSDIKEASKLRFKAREYELLEGVLYRRSFLTSWLRYVGPLQADYVIQEIHEGSCSMHVGPWFMVAKAIRLGYYWPTMQWDARDMIRACNNCQIHRPVTRNPQQPLTLITAPWPFYKWVRGVTFRPGDFVYRSIDASHAVDSGKLGPKWEGPYDVMEALGDGAYKLRSAD
nr:reverse transcriptase domain-containing protein [Tanacetum cinerariifolium]